MGFVVTLALGLADQAKAQLPRYRATPLVALGNGFTPDADGHGTLGINNKGQVVYGYIDPTTSDYHAWVWLPANDYGLNAGFYDLADETTTADDDISIARDINESGVEVGQTGDELLYGGAAVGAAWTISGGTVTLTALPLFSGGAWSAATAINDQSPPVIVGMADSGDGDCDCAHDIDVEETPTPFKMDFTGTLALTALSVGNDADGLATDVNTPTGSDPLRIVGLTDCTGTQEEEEQEGECVRAPSCRPPMSAVNWSPSTRNVMTDQGVNGSHARGINDAAENCGWAFDPTTCLRVALVWATPTSTPISLPPRATGYGARAQAMNGLSPPQIVGLDEFTGHGVLWEYINSSPLAIDLDGSSAIGTCTSRWGIIEAHDINDSGWIITWGFDTYNNNATYAILLTPFPECPWDIVVNGDVDTDDLLELLSQWGNCVIGVICTADVDGSCTVDTDDLLALYAEWGEGACTESLLGGGGPPSIEELIAIILVAPVADEIKEEAIKALLENAS